MRVLLFSDIHASRKSAQDIEDLAYRFDALYCCGDICGFDRDFEYVIDMFIDLNVKAVKGNHDHMVLDSTFGLDLLPSRVAEPVRWTRERIKGRYLDYLSGLPDELEGEGLFITHTWDFDFYVREKEHCTPLLCKTKQPIIGIGHTHVPGLFDFGNQKVVNPGSIAFGRRGHSRGYAVIDDGSVTFETLE